MKLQTDKQKKLKQRNDRIFAEYQRIKSEADGATIYQVATQLSKRYKLDVHWIVKIIRNYIE